MIHVLQRKQLEHQYLGGLRLWRLLIFEYLPQRERGYVTVGMYVMWQPRIFEQSDESCKKIPIEKMPARNPSLSYDHKIVRVILYAVAPLSPFLLWRMISYFSPPPVVPLCEVDHFPGVSIRLGASALPRDVLLPSGRDWRCSSARQLVALILRKRLAKTESGGSCAAWRVSPFSSTFSVAISVQ